MTIELITGTPGAGKTTYAVSQRLDPESRRELTMELNGATVTARRRLFVAGIPGLLVEHEKLPHTLTADAMAQPVIDYFNQVDADGELVHRRLRGDPPVEIPAELVINGKRYAAGPSIFNWWLWVEPGDMICVDEVQYIVPRGAVGRKPPPYIALLEVHRHYGVDFLLTTQHPQLLDTTIRNLVGMHRHIRSVMASPVCMVYVWDHASNPERFTLATKSQFVRRKKHYRLFKSAAGHVKPPSSGRAIFWIVPALLLVCVLIGLRMRERLAPAKSTAAVVHDKAPGAADAGGAPLGLGSLASKVGPKVPTASDRDWPTYVAEPVQANREPLDGRAVQWEGSYVVGGKSVNYFGMLIDGERVTTLTLADLTAMGYRWVVRGPCVGSLQFGLHERLVTCGKRPAVPSTNDVAPEAAAASQAGA